MKAILIILMLVVSASAYTRAKLILSPKTGPCITIVYCHNGNCDTNKVGLLFDVSMPEDEIVHNMAKDTEFVKTYVKLNLTTDDIKYLIRGSKKAASLR